MLWFPKRLSFFLVITWPWFYIQNKIQCEPFLENLYWRFFDHSLFLTSIAEYRYPKVITLCRNCVGRRHAPTEYIYNIYINWCVFQVVISLASLRNARKVEKQLPLKKKHLRSLIKVWLYRLIVLLVILGYPRLSLVILGFQHRLPSRV